MNRVAQPLFSMFAPSILHSFIRTSATSFRFNLSTAELPLQPMKIFACIMAVIIFVLSAMPCVDIGAGKQACKYVLAKEKKQNNPLNDNCSPFCLCNCCAGFSVYHQIITVPVLPSTPTKHNSKNHFNAVIKVAIPILAASPINLTLLLQTFF